MNASWKSSLWVFFSDSLKGPVHNIHLSDYTDGAVCYFVQPVRIELNKKKCFLVIILWYTDLVSPYCLWVQQRGSFKLFMIIFIMCLPEQVSALMLTCDVQEGVVNRREAVWTLIEFTGISNSYLLLLRWQTYLFILQG